MHHELPAAPPLPSSSPESPLHWPAPASCPYTAPARLHAPPACAGPAGEMWHGMVSSCSCSHVSHLFQFFMCLWYHASMYYCRLLFFPVMSSTCEKAFILLYFLFFLVVMHTFILLSIQECASRRVAKAQKGIVFPSPPLKKESKGHCWPILLARSNYQSAEKVASLLLC